MAEPLKIDELSNWVKKKRDKHGWSIETLAREITNKGYPISSNKIWRLEVGKIKKIDYEFLIRLEAVFQEQFTSTEANHSTEKVVSVEAVLQLIDKLQKGETLPPEKRQPELLLIYEKLQPTFEKLRKLKSLLFE